MSDKALMNRRDVLLVAAGCAAALPVFGELPETQASMGLTPQERENEAIVTNMCKAWNKQDMEKILFYMGKDLHYEVWEGGMVVDGHEAFRKNMDSFVNGMKSIDWEIKRSTAIGDIVINERLDHFYRPKEKKAKDLHFHVTGVFLVRGGKIRYWKDYNMPKE